MRNAVPRLIPATVLALLVNAVAFTSTVEAASVQLAAHVHGDSAVLTWEAVADADSYELNVEGVGSYHVSTSACFRSTCGVELGGSLFTDAAAESQATVAAIHGENRSATATTTFATPAHRPVSGEVGRLTAGKPADEDPGGSGGVFADWVKNALNLQDLAANPHGVTGQGVTIGVIELGAPNLSHPYLGGTIDQPVLIGANGELADLQPADADYGSGSVYHATAVTGLIVGTGATPGIAPGATIRPYAIGADVADAAAMAAAVERAIADDVDVINMSVSTPQDSDRLDAALRSARDAGILVVVAAGNHQAEECYPGGWPVGTPTLPAVSPEVLTVGATDISNDLWDCSVDFAGVDVLAPGVDVPLVPSNQMLTLNAFAGAHLVDNPPQLYRLESGTSLSSPIVAATAALMLERDPSLTPAEIGRLLSDSIDEDGVIEPLRALELAAAPRGTQATHSWELTLRGVEDLLGGGDTTSSATAVTFRGTLTVDQSSGSVVGHDVATEAIDASGNRTVLFSANATFDLNCTHRPADARPAFVHYPVSVVGQYDPAGDYFTVLFEIEPLRAEFVDGRDDACSEEWCVLNTALNCPTYLDPLLQFDPLIYAAAYQQGSGTYIPIGDPPEFLPYTPELTIIAL